MNKVVKYILKFLGWFFLGVIVLLILVGLLIQTRPVKKKVAEIATSQAGNFLKGNFELGKIKGNFFSHLELEHLLWKYDDDTVAYIENLKLKYDLRPLLNGQVQVFLVEINQPFFYLKQENDSTWNIQQLIKSSSSATDTTKSGSSFNIDLRDVKLNEGRINFDTRDTLIPKQIQQLNTTLSFRMKKNLQSLQLSRFSFIAKNPDLTLAQLTFDIKKDNKSVNLTDFLLQTSENEIRGNGDFLIPEKEGRASFQSNPLHPEEFKFVLPGLSLPANPEFKLNAELKNDSLNGRIELNDKEQLIGFDFSADHFVEFITNPSSVELEYWLSGNLDKINLAHWTGNEQLDYLINGELTAQGKGTDPKTAKLALTGNFKDIIVEDKPVDKLLFDFNLDHGNLSGQAEGSGNFGSFNIEPAIQNLFDVPAYEITIETRKLDLAQLTGNDSLRSNINLYAHVKGQGFEPKTLNVKGIVKVADSQFNSLTIDSVHADVEYDNNNIRIDSLWLKTNAADVKANGNYALKSNSDLRLTVHLDSISDFESFLPITGLKTSGDIKAHLWGTFDSLNLETAINLDSTIYQTFFIDKLIVNANAKADQTDTLVSADLNVYHFQNDKLIVDSVNMNVKASLDSMQMNGSVVGKDIATTVKGRMNWKNQLRITLEDWIVDYKGQHLALQDAPAVITIDSVNYSVNHLKMASNASDTAQYFLAEGNISRNGNEDLKLSLNNIDVGEWMEFFGNPVDATGMVQFNVIVEGTANSPVINGDFGIRNAEFNEYRFTEFGGSFGYEGNQFKLQSEIVPVDSGRLEFSGEVPVVIKLDSFNFDYSPKDSLYVHLTVDRFPLAMVQMMNVADNISGYIDGNIDVTGTAESPDPKGELKLIDAAVKIREYGIDYRNIKFNLSLLKDNIRLDTLAIETEDGVLTGNGTIDFTSDFYKGDISQSEIKLNFHKFNPVNHPQFNMQLSGNASLGGEKGNVVFDGDLNVPEAEIYLPAIMNLMGRIYVPDIPKPILVKEMEDQNTIPDSIRVVAEKRDTTEQFNFNYFDQLTGNLRIKIPKNTWVKNEDLRIELSGDLELVKNNTFVELFGSVNVVRGQYDMLGRTFIIDEGMISFEGGEEIMPKMNITATYSFRTAQREEKKLTVNITGTAESPEVSFTLDGNAISEGDAVSYIFFGRSMNELTSDQQDNLAGSGGGQLAEKAAASVLSAQLSNFLSKNLDVDYIEVKSNEGFDNATVVVGKYITNDLFVSYEQRFGTTEQSDIAKYEVKLEYELFKFLFLQLNNSSIDSGFDVIFKLNSK